MLVDEWYTKKHNSDLRIARATELRERKARERAEARGETTEE
jgi:hypothetical protein